MFRFLSIAWWSHLIFGDPTSRPRRMSTWATSLVLAVEVLHQRILLAADVGIDVADQAVPGESLEAQVWYLPSNSGSSSGGRYGGEFSAMFTGVALGPTATDVDVAVDGVFYGPGFEIVGQDQGTAAGQLFLPDGTRDDVTHFQSLLSAQGNGGGQDGRIRGVALTSDGVLYVGDSRGDADIEQVTYWFSPNLPEGGRGATGAQDGGFYLSVSQDGVFVGSDDVPLYGTPGNLPQRLPGLNTVIAADISANSEFIVGDLIWVANELGGYDVLDTSSFDFSTSFEEPTWKRVEVDGHGDVFFVGEYFSFETFDVATGYWNYTGDFLGSYDGFSADKALVAGEVITGLNFNGEGFLVRPRDGASIAVAELLGVDGPVAIRGLFSTEGALGLVLEDAQGQFTAVLSTVSLGGSGDPARANLLVDFNSDGVIDREFENTNGEDFSFSFPSAGTYTVTVIAVDANGNELGRDTKEVTVSPYRVENRDGTNVLILGADQNRGSSMSVSQLRNGSLRVTVDRTRGVVEASHVEVHGSDRNDRLTLNGSFSAMVQLYGGNDSMTALGLSSLTADMGAGNDRATSIFANEVSIWGGLGNDSITSLWHSFGYFNGGDGRDSILSRGANSFIVGGMGADSITSLDQKAVVLAGDLAVSSAEEEAFLVDLVFAELDASRPNKGLLDDLLLGVYVDDGELDRGLVWGNFAHVIQDPRDRVRSRR